MLNYKLRILYLAIVSDQKFGLNDYTFSSRTELLLRCDLNTILVTDLKDKSKDSYIMTFKDLLKSQSTNELVLDENSKVQAIQRNLNLHLSIFCQHKTCKLTNRLIHSFVRGTLLLKLEFQTPCEISIRQFCLRWCSQSRPSLKRNTFKKSV